MMSLNAWEYETDSCCIIEDGGSYTMLARVCDSGFGKMWEGPDIIPAQTLQFSIDCQISVCEPPIVSNYV
jgi:hypothetical protein